MAQTPVHSVLLRDAIIQYGPLPHMVNVIPGSIGIVYEVHIQGADGVVKISHHPLSNEGRAALGDRLSKLSCEFGNPRQTIGVGHPPITYKPSEWTWERRCDCKFSSKASIRFFREALALSGVSLSDQEVKDCIIDSFKVSDQGQLYHPEDRKQLFMPRMERALAWVARKYNRSLIVVGPEVSKSTLNWNQVFSPLSSSRPAVRARWGEGMQDTYLPVIVGCIPAPEYQRLSSNTSSYNWYFLRPTNEKGYKKYWELHDWTDLAKGFRCKVPRNLAWAVVAAQRSWQLDIPGVKDAQLGEWIYQYTLHLGAGRAGTPFVYNKSNNWQGPKPTYNNITSWTLRSADHEFTQEFTESWNKVISKFLRYHYSLKREDWDVEFLSAVLEMSRLIQ